jgi:N-acetylneuraminic acid mutarotase
MLSRGIKMKFRKIICLMVNMIFLFNTIGFSELNIGWLQKTSLSSARTGPGAAVVNDKIYVIGGEADGYLKTVEQYDPVADTWTTKASMPTV